MIVVGIDPGSQGGVGRIEDGEASAKKIPKTLHDRRVMLQTMLRGADFVFLEHAHAWRGEGATSVFTSGRNYGELRMGVAWSGVQYEVVAALKWQNYLDLAFPKGRYTKTQKKNIHKDKAKELFPDIKMTHAIADALLIAHYGWGQVH